MVKRQKESHQNQKAPGDSCCHTEAEQQRILRDQHHGEKLLMADQIYRGDFVSHALKDRSKCNMQLFSRIIWAYRDGDPVVAGCLTDVRSIKLGAVIDKR